MTKKILNKRKRSTEKVKIENMPAFNRTNKNVDAQILRRKGILSPDISTMKYKVYDPQLRITRFFRTKVAYDEFMKKQTT